MHDSPTSGQYRHGHVKLYRHCMPNLLLPGALPPNVKPFTGLVVSDLASLHRRPLTIKISHFPRYVRPQAGLQAADLVFEHYAEGGTARFTAIFYVNAPERVGPVRSARLIDTVIPEMVDGALVTSGSSSGTMQSACSTSLGTNASSPNKLAQNARCCAAKAKIPTRSLPVPKPFGKR